MRAVYTDGILFELIQVSETYKILAEKQSSSKEEDRFQLFLSSVCLALLHMPVLDDLFFLLEHRSMQYSHIYILKTWQPDELAKLFGKLAVADVEEIEKEKTEAELLAELAELLGRKPSEVSGMWSVAKETGYCLHCIRVLLVPFLSLKELQTGSSKGLVS